VHGDPLLRVTLVDGRPASVRLGSGATVVAVGDDTVSSFDLRGRPYALVREGLTWRRALDGRFLLKGRDASTGLRLRRREPAESGWPTVAGAQADAVATAEALRVSGSGTPSAEAAQAQGRLATIAAMDAAALEADVARYRQAYAGGVGILPPDQYLSLVVQVTQGCSWNACTFCDFYRHTPFGVKSVERLDAHLADLRGFFGASEALRRTLFLGDANALCVGHERLLPLLERLTNAFPVAPAELEGPALRAWAAERPERKESLSSFVDVYTGARKGVAEYRRYARLGLRRVYVGLESGDPDLLRWLDKPGTGEEARQLAATLHEAGIAVGVIVLLGAGGETFFETHAARTAALLERLRLGPRDLLYFSELVESEDLPYAERAARDGVQPLTPERLEKQRQRILQGLPDGAARPRVATYDIREFVY
jgi:hypothetical protein